MKRLSSHPDDRADDRFPLPPWLGPPQDELGVPVALQGSLVRTSSLVIALSSATAFTTGCAFDLVWSARRDDQDDETWAERLDLLAQGPWMVRRSSARGHGLRFGIHLADARKVTTATFSAFGNTDISTPPRDAVLLDLSGPGSGAEDAWSQQVRLWLWPLPPPGDMELLCTWPEADIAQEHISLDADALLVAAASVWPLWP